MTNEVQNDAQLVVRLPQAMMARLDAYAEQLQGEMPGAKFSRANVARMLLSKALDTAEAETSTKRKRGRSEA